MGAVELTHDPAGLASALKKLERMQPRSVWQQILYPANRGPESAVLRSHPHTHKRIEVLMDLVPRYEGQEPIITAAPRRADYPNSMMPIHRSPHWHYVTGLWH